MMHFRRDPRFQQRCPNSSPGPTAVGPTRHGRAIVVAPRAAAPRVAPLTEVLKPTGAQQARSLAEHVSDPGQSRAAQDDTEFSGKSGPITLSIGGVTLSPGAQSG